MRETAGRTHSLNRFLLSIQCRVKLGSGHMGIRSQGTPTIQFRKFQNVGPLEIRVSPHWWPELFGEKALILTNR
ncbi:uncharacterized protein FOMMEDRAFT_20094 [Fomitiporia mediterranea MF3/22]|uniref:uncharacterized protein n=1 Tax=Fomitiporia mediterranea (strain MF3/22) TaxID=694068 RepID=UPI0004409B91|nr:uncharacterized protein FOMMEDRAFT_20094 [Fomitiporia mediterranea MF3/22]EJD02872.1 hypothetical protein FOMMEDRAFT_20094 [Fomitiporia mediterranea MF3/22]